MVDTLGPIVNNPRPGTNEVLATRPKRAQAEMQRRENAAKQAAKAAERMVESRKLGLAFS